MTRLSPVLALFLALALLALQAQTAAVVLPDGALAARAVRDVGRRLSRPAASE